MPIRARHRGAAAFAIFLSTLAAVTACSTSSSPIPAVPSSAGPASPGSTTPTGPITPSDSAVPAESAPPGDIPDNVAFVVYDNAAGRYAFPHPEGWAQVEKGTGVSFTDKLNSVAVDSQPATQAPTVTDTRSTEIPRLQSGVPAFELRDVRGADLPAGTGVKIVYRRNSDPDPVTGKVYRDEVEEYLLFRSGRLVRMELTGPVGADNVDAYAKMSGALTIR